MVKAGHRRLNGAYAAQYQDLWRYREAHPFDVATYRALRNAGHESILTVQALSDSELAAIPGIGPKRLAQLRRALGRSQ
jgi:hypothetical protein